MAEIPVPEGHINGGVPTAALNPSEPIGSKRQRRPSVRLGDIGDQPIDSHPRRTAKLLRYGFSNASGKPSKTRPLTNLTSTSDFGETLEIDDRETNADGIVVGSWKVRDSKKRGSSASTAKKPRSIWISSRIDEFEDVENEYRNFDANNSGSPINSSENFGDDERHEHEHDYDIVRGDRNGNGGRGSCGEDGVRIWLNGLGLSRYAAVFQIHEVDDEVLPFLTIDDLKDMGINAVGSRRKMYCAIQKLSKGFS